MPQTQPDDEPGRLLEGYLRRLRAGEEVERAELEAAHPGEAEQLWRRIEAWRNVERALPGAQPEAAPPEEPRVAIRFHSLGAELEEGLDAALIEGAAEPAELAARLAERGRSIARYEPVEELARGAMGAILRVVDRDLGRELAMKVMLARGDATSEGAERQTGPDVVARFVEEARVTGRLEHPGIPPVHDFGVDSEGNFYFTMPWIRGQTLREVFRRVRAGEPGWTRARAVGLLLQVCDAVAYAHAQGVVHRDLKPRNVMVGEFGEVFVMDWGLARDRARQEVSDIRIASPEEDKSSPIRTCQGVVIGTPCYMSPEQARGDSERVGPGTDVYALGAILYELLTEHPPYLPTGSRSSGHEILRLVRSEAPAAVLAERKEVPPELAAICNKAMAREVEARYADVAQLAAELRSFQEGRVVQSYATGPWVELRKWIGRNRAVAFLAGLLLVVALAGAAGMFSVERARRATVERELDMSTAERLVETAERLGPTAPRSVPAMEAWVSSAEGLIARRPLYQRELADFEAIHAAAARREVDSPELPFDPRVLEYERFKRDLWQGRLASHDEELSAAKTQADRARVEQEPVVYGRELPRVIRNIERLEFDLASVRAWRYVDEELDREHLRLWEMSRDLARLAGPEHDLLGRVRARLERARRLAQETLVKPAAAWEAAVASIADRGECPLYGGLELEPRLGLVPLGRNAGGLWEFWLPISGERPEAREAGGYEIGPESGMVFVLVPGGESRVGAQDDDPDAPNYVAPEVCGDAPLNRDQKGVRVLRLAPYFLSKFELTQGQWERLTGENPSEYYAGTWMNDTPIATAADPVASVSHRQCVEALALWGLGLPTEAQWEVAARAGSEFAFPWGETWPPPAERVNFGDASHLRATHRAPGEGDPDDGFPLLAPVDSLRPNAWGFHHLLGNAKEWCRDWYQQKCYGGELLEDTSEMRPGHATYRSYRGGSCFEPGPETFRSSKRRSATPGTQERDLGLRPVLEGLE